MNLDPEELTSEADFLSWVNTIQQLEEARVHLDSLISQMEAENKICVIDFGVQLGHIYGHLNRTWNGKYIPGGNADEWNADQQSDFPTDVLIT